MRAEVIYESPYDLDVTSAVNVLAFLLVPTQAFDAGGPHGDRLINDAKRDALLKWYAAHTGVKLK